MLVACATCGGILMFQIIDNGLSRVAAWTPESAGRLWLVDPGTGWARQPRAQWRQRALQQRARRHAQPSAALVGHRNPDTASSVQNPGPDCRALKSCTLSSMQPFISVNYMHNLVQPATTIILRTTIAPNSSALRTWLGLLLA